MSTPSDDDQREKSVLLKPEILKRSFREGGDSYALVYDLPVIPNCLSWNNGVLALGHDSGLNILSPVSSNTHSSRNLPTKFQQDNLFQLSSYPLNKPVALIRFFDEQLLAVHDDNTFSVLNHVGSDDNEHVLFGGKGNGHTRDINSIDLNSHGLIATTGDDKQLLIWKMSDSSAPAMRYQLNNIGTLVKFFPATSSANLQSDYLVIVEANNIIRILDITASKFIITIYPLPLNVNSEESSINDIIIQNTSLIVVGKGWWKSYSLEAGNLLGGAAMTFPSAEEYLINYMASSKYLRSESGQHNTDANKVIGSITTSFVSVYQLQGSSIINRSKIDLQFPSESIIDGEINKHGKAAVINGSKLCLVNTD